MGTEIASSSPVLTVIFGFLLGTVVVLAEPAVHVLNRQVEEVTSGEQRTAPRAHSVAKNPEAQSQRDGADWMLRYMKK